MTPPPRAAIVRQGDADDLLAFDEERVARARWERIDEHDGLTRWRLHDATSQRRWLLVGAGPRACAREQARLDREYAMAPCLDAAWAVPPLALLTTPRGPALLLDDQDGRPLSGLIMGALSVERFLRVAVAAASALAQAHRRGLVHRDIRPENLFLGSDGEIRLTGFAFAVLGEGCPDAPLHSTDSSLAYLAPERAGRPGAPGSQRGDLYALGVTFYRLLTGHLPFNASDPVQWLHMHVAVPAPAIARWRPGLPAALEELVAWLLHKQPEKRPESALALEAELRRFLNEWRELGSIGRSDAQRDSSPGRRPSAPLVGREAELQTLHAAVRRLQRGCGGALLIEGEPGIGKTTLVRHLWRNLPADTLLFANGKCEQARHNLPYAVLASALSSLFARLVGESPEDVKRWGRRLRDAVGEHGDLAARVVPELEWLTGPLGSAGAPPVSEARRHLHGTLQRLLGLIARAEHPLILFLDDVQWIDPESLSFLEELGPTLFDHLLLIAAYRDEPLGEASRLPAFIERCRALGARTLELRLHPLAASEIATLLSSELDLHPAERSLLAGRLSQRGNGNPLYVSQAIAVLRESSERPEAPPALFDDVAAMMRSRLERLPERTRRALGRLALLGNHTPPEALALVSGTDVPQLFNLLRPAFKAGLVGEYQDGLAFTHDAVWESARAQLPEATRQAMHLAFAQALLDALPAAALPEAVFRVATQVLAIGGETLDASRRLDFIELLMHAARLAKASAAASTALAYLHHAAELLRMQVPHHESLGRAVELLYAQCLILSADYTAAEACIGVLLAKADGHTERCELHRLKCEISCLRGDYAGAVHTAIDGLASLGFALPRDPGGEETEQAWRAVERALSAQSPAILERLPRVREPQLLATLELLASIVIPGSFIHPNLMLLSTCRLLELSLQHGMSAAAVHALAWLGVSIAQRHDACREGFELTALARRLADQEGYASARISTLVALDQVSAWTRPLPFALECAETAYRQSLAQGTPSFACYANTHVVSDLLVLGAPIERMLRQIDSGLELARNLEFVDAQTILYTQALYIRRLAGEVGTPIPIPAPEAIAERVAQSSMGPLHFWWQLFEGLFHFLEGAFERAAGHLDRAWALTWAAPVHIHQIDLALFTVLNRAALQSSSGIAQDFEQPLGRLRLWAGTNPRYFADRLALAEAEVLRIGGHDMAALQHYEDAIAKATQCGAIHIRGLAHELEARHLAALGLAFGAQTHLRLARDAWRRWGAKKLADQLEAQHAFLREQPAVPPPGAVLPGAQQLDMVAITRACQALSREIEPDALIKTLLANTAMHAGATYAALLLADAGALRVEASGLADASGIDIRLRANPTATDAAPLSLVAHVMRHRESLVLDGTEALRRFEDDPYLLRLECASVACVPLLKQNETIGVLYLENTLTPGAFEPARVDVLELLAAQAAISLSNARLYTDLLAENRRRRLGEDTLRRTQALMAIGQAVSRYSTFVWRPAEEPSPWTRRLVAELGLPLPGGGDPLHDPALLVHPDDRLRFHTTLAHAVEQHEAFRLEFRTLELDGGPRYLELAGEPDDGAETFIGVISDITERRRTETDLRTARSELERTAQATVLGELAASIAHEINQPLASILSNAGASIRWLERAHPQIDDALEGIRDILAEGQRAAGIVTAVRALARQAPPDHAPVQVDEVIRSVLAITQADIHDKHVSVTLALAHDARARGDAVQLQQVMHNLITNAVEAMQSLPPGARRLTIGSQRVGGEILVTVEDTGPGIAAEDQARVFQAFYSTKASGMGMGLAICSSIVAAHGGTLRATQGRHGESLFFFTLPALGEAEGRIQDV
ncbi:hypothetical protein DMX10_19020 [Pseudomonas sp. 57B-090624]|uniref:trifunctional serine/threonine-protein kinase/ATP-binding protein/sensor histidine kinase n=1 Tax=Pseudomonas sp. 57B-090624 TaxID=2213080 RepID=UPI000DA8B382|nr:AAA family ATPase [Pseudomonas sp. 57B-090624]PZE11774.1 hypothetical protein DMX10_19020 [Pseudomonas sp. 57B-090624]